MNEPKPIFKRFDRAGMAAFERPNTAGKVWRQSLTDIREQLKSARFSIPFSIFCEPVVRGACCRTIFRNGRPFIIMGALGVLINCGNESIKLCAANYEKKTGRNAEPSASVIDSQSIKTTERRLDRQLDKLRRQSR